MDHATITAMIGGAENYGKGITPNPFNHQRSEWIRQSKHQDVLFLLNRKIESLFEPRFITPPETSQCIASLITMTDSRRILELGTCTGYTTLHMLMAVYGKPDAKVVSVDARPAHDREFWARDEFLGVLEFVEGWTPEAIAKLTNNQIGYGWDFIFIDSDHSIEHTKKELEVLWPQTRPGTVFCFHDVPQWQTPTNRFAPPVREWLLDHPGLQGLCLPSCEQLDCLDAYGYGYPKETNPGLGIFIRK